MSNSKKRAPDRNDTGKNNREQDDSILDKNGKELVFEDPFGDEFEEEIIDEQERDIDIEEENEDLVDGGDDNIPIQEPDVPTPKKVWRPGVDQIAEGEVLDYDPRAYIMYHALSTEWPCLSFDIIKDSLGDSRQRVRTLLV